MSDDIVEVGKLLHGKERTVHADAGYIGAEKRESMTRRGRTWCIAAKRGSVKAMSEGELKEATKHLEHPRIVAGCGGMPCLCRRHAGAVPTGYRGNAVRGTAPMRLSCGDAIVHEVRAR